ncbi:hypothetical protein [Mesorhizobium sp. M0491]|uniref:hypothetical protein n=1 Tax=Mesorhizobium sp. M0491 TaxID=2956950 RepID=UPI00333B6A8C
MQIFDRISSLIDADDCQAAIEDARALLLQFGQKSDALTHAIDEFLLDLMTLATIQVPRRESSPEGCCDSANTFIAI